MRVPNVFTISPASPFLDTFVAGLLDGAVVPGFAPRADPLALSGATIYVPTRRAARALAETFLRQSAGAATLLPRILPLGALEATETQLILAEPDPAAVGLPLPAAATPIWRRLRLATLIQAWAEAISGALRSVDASGTVVVDPSEAFRVATSTIDAFALAGDLAALMDEMQIEGVAWRTLDTLRMGDFDDYWRITTTFLAIAMDQWPKILAEKGLVDPAARQIALVDAQVRTLADGPNAGPVIAIGSTGTNRATARLLAAIGRAPQGAVVLPGLDKDLDDGAWTLIAGVLGEGQEPSFGHPQAAMARLLPILGVSRDDVRVLGTPEPTLATRARYVAEAMRPADTTDLWRTYSRAVPRKARVAALDTVALIEAADEREEALCLAIAMREILETPDRTGALVTPDRELARRVRGELLRWDIEVSDSGGEPLATRPLGVLARLVAQAAATGMAARDVTALLSHPLATLGRTRDAVAHIAARLDVGVLRTIPISGKTTAALFTDAREAAGDPHAHRTQKAITESEWVAMSTLWDQLTDALAPLRALRGARDLAGWVDAHRAALAAIAGEAAAEEADALEELFAALAPEDGPLRFTAESYGIFFGRVATEVTLRNTNQPYPRLQILGLLEARLIQADVMLLGGLDETLWPPAAASDPFLNRPMRHELGLSPPERRIGQTAHDFVQALGGDTVVLSRARKRGGSPCVPSRFLLRLAALGGTAWETCRERGQRTLHLARVLDKPKRAPVPIARPRPVPPVALRPTRLSVTQIETLRRDPYAIYAAHILAIAPLPRIGEGIDPGAFGNIMHDALHDFAESDAADGAPASRRNALLAIVQQAFASALEDPSFRAFRWPLIKRAIDAFLRFDARQREDAARIVVETTGSLVLTLADLSPFSLNARADRIDFHHDGSATLIDYKTGQPPGNKEVQVGFAPQLTLEAAILRGGGFGTVHQGGINATYLKLGGRDGGGPREVKFDDEPFDAVVDRHFAGLHRLLSSFRAVETGYPSRPFPKYAKRYGTYDHLARVREWSLAAEDEATP